MAGKPLTFGIAWLCLIFWVTAGLIFGFTDSWLLLINTVATVNASFMVFVIQNTQNRENKALHIKVDELLLAIKEARNEMVAIEQIEEEDLEALRNRLHQNTPPKTKI